MAGLMMVGADGFLLHNPLNGDPQINFVYVENHVIYEELIEEIFVIFQLYEQPIPGMPLPAPPFFQVAGEEEVINPLVTPPVTPVRDVEHDLNVETSSGSVSNDNNAAAAAHDEIEDDDDANMNHITNSEMVADNNIWQAMINGEPGSVTPIRLNPPPPRVVYGNDDDDDDDDDQYHQYQPVNVAIPQHPPLNNILHAPVPDVNPANVIGPNFTIVYKNEQGLIDILGAVDYPEFRQQVFAIYLVTW